MSAGWPLCIAAPEAVEGETIMPALCVCRYFICVLQEEGLATDELFIFTASGGVAVVSTEEAMGRMNPSILKTIGFSPHRVWPQCGQGVNM